MLAKVGLDGHDRGVRVLARAFRDAGMEVIYTGLWQTPAAAVKAAVEEDVDVLGVSFHSAAHLTLVPLIRQEINKVGRGDIPVVLGGIIPAQDHAAMRDCGVAAVFEPESSLATIIESCRALGAKTQAARRAELANGAVDQWLGAAGRGERPALARLLTWIESYAGPADAQARLQAPPPKSGRLIGVTGAPGVGKSTLIGQLIRAVRKRGPSVGVIAVDPASPITGGALLGDRARMTASAEDTGVFIRSAASRGAMGGVAGATRPMAAAMLAGGLERVVVETVGAGQNDVAVREFAWPVVLVLMPGAGDDLQLDKAGITEIADVFVINKADLPGADRLEGQIRDTIGGHKPIVRTIASHGEGIDRLADVLLGLSGKS
ncbi:MAG: cobalamin-dependent protein [Phycisphaerae bacterium]